MRDATMAGILTDLALGAGAAIMEVYRRPDVTVRAKADDSPLTEADLAADALIVAGLQAAYPATPVVSEERAAGHAAAMTATHFLVDPLDGTREFVHRRGEFTVNIALIDGGRPVAGVVFAPAVGRLFRTEPGGGAVEVTVVDGVAGPARPIAVRRANAAALRVVASRSHRDAGTDACLARHRVAEIVSVGSSLKFCLLATGEADFYPRFGRTMEWDTAAGHAVLEAAGGQVVRLDDHAPLLYGKPGRENPGFLAAVPGVDLDGTDPDWRRDRRQTPPDP